MKRWVVFVCVRGRWRAKNSHLLPCCSATAPQRRERLHRHQASSDHSTSDGEERTTAFEERARSEMKTRARDVEEELDATGKIFSHA